MLGAIGHAAAFSFNYFKNMTCGEGGAVVTNDDECAARMRCAVDCCGFYWEKERSREKGFTSNGSRASEFEGAILNAQLDRIGDMVRVMRRQKIQVLRETADTGLKPIPANSLKWECGTHIMYQLPSAVAADRFAALAGGTVALKTGRHVYTEWTPVLEHRGAHHPAMNPFKMPANRKCRMTYTRDQCARSLDILGRTVFIGNHPDLKAAGTRALVRRIRAAAKEVL
jgi:dTDP-4-amino-4,6-dideoxygalactose transaminase